MTLSAGSGESVADKAVQELAAWRQDIRRQALARRSRESTTFPRRWRFGTFAFLVLVQLSILVAWRTVMQEHPPSAETIIQVRFLEPDAAEPPLPNPPSRNVDAAVHRVVRTVAPATSAAPARVESADPAIDSSALFNPDGSIRMPAEAAASAPTPQDVAAELMHRGHNIVHCRTTRFARAYKRDESLGDEISRKYLVWVGLYNRDVVEARAERKRAEAAAACDE